MINGSQAGVRIEIRNETFRTSLVYNRSFARSYLYPLIKMGREKDIPITTSIFC